MKILLAGGTGFLGGSLARELAGEGHDLTIVTRRPDRQGLFASPRIRYVRWDGRDAAALAGHAGESDAVVNLAGESVAGGRWTNARKKILIESRVGTTEALVGAIALAKIRPKTLVNASAVGYYGDAGEAEVDESHPAGGGFLASLCAQWEAAARKAEEHGLRVVTPRIGFVLGGKGSALGRMALPFRLYAGGPLASGRQWFPWVHVADIAGIFRAALLDDRLRGPVNAVAPQPVRNREFCLELGRALRRPSWAPVPAFALRLILGELAEMLIGGQKATPAALRKAGYEFRHPALDAALRDALGVGESAGE